MQQSRVRVGTKPICSTGTNKLNKKHSDSFFKLAGHMAEIQPFQGKKRKKRRPHATI